MFNNSKKNLIFLASTQYAGNNFYRLLSGRGIIFTTYSVGVE